MADDILKLVEEYKRLDRRRRLRKGNLPVSEEARYEKLRDMLAKHLHGETPNERRKELRVPTAIKVRYAAERTFINNYIHNLSKGGVFISTPKPLPLNTKLKLKLIFQDKDKEIEVQGKVVWENTEQHSRHDITRPGMGIKFTKLSEEAQSQIDEIIHDHITESAKKNDS